MQNGDLDRLIGLARVVRSAQDALTDDIVSRLFSVVSDGLALLEKVNRSGVDRLLEILERGNFVGELFDCLNRATQDTRAAGHVCGGLGGLWEIARDPNAQDAMCFLVVFGKHFRDCWLARDGRKAKWPS